MRVPIILAALRGKMLRLAVEKADGAFTNFLPLAGLPKVVEQLGDAPEGFELLCRFFCIPGEREQVEPLARFMFSSYITVPVYENFYRWLGYGEKIDAMVEAWNAKDRQKAAEEAPWDLIEEMFIFGEPAQMKERLEAFVEGGITLPVITPITTPERLGELIDGPSALALDQKRTYSRSWPMPASIAWMMPSGAFISQALLQLGLVLAQPLLMRLELLRREPSRIRAEEELEQARRPGARTDRSSAPRASDRAPPPLPSSAGRCACGARLLAAFREQVRLGEPAALRIELGVRQRPELAHAERDCPLQVIGRRGLHLLDQPEDDVRGRCEAGL